jgi:hypothetical protein
MMNEAAGMTTRRDDPIVQFYAGQAPDSRGRFLGEVWGFSDQELEGVHDYIQWLFPLPRPSAFNPYAPVMTDGTAREFHASAELRERLNRSAEIMLRFYGLESVKAADGVTSVRQTAEYIERARNWVARSNHNHLRLSRILESTRLLGLEDFSRALLGALEDIAASHTREISATTLDFWRKAAGL